jgi:hypothetical protein
LVEKCEAEIGQSVRHVLDSPPASFEHDVRFQNIAGGVIGFAYFPDPNRCGQKTTARLDSSFNPSALTFANLCTHEYKGHSDGLEHTRGGIMNPSIITINPLSWKGDNHESTKRKYFGGEPIPTTAPPPVDPGQPNAQSVYLRMATGAVEVVALKDLTAKRGDVIGRYIFNPAFG